MTSKKIVNVLLLLAVGIVAGISFDELARAKYEVTPPMRPSNVPPSAKWEGGEDGGNWFDCTRQADSKYLCAVFSDTTGAKISEGLYGVTPEDMSGRLNPVLLRSDTEIVISGARLIRIP